MGNKMSMVALDKFEKRLSVPLRVFVKYETRAKKSGRTVAEEMNIELAHGVKDDDFGPDEKARFDELYNDNLARRNAKKAKKGIR